MTPLIEPIGSILNDLLQQHPNTAEQQELFDYVLQELQNTSTYKQPVFIYLTGAGGSGKTVLCKKLIALSRSLGNISLGCASTALASTLYDDFTTAHSLFKFPVRESEDYESEDEPACRLHKFPQRVALLKATRLIIWDEWMSNNKDIFEASYKALD